MCRHLAYMGPPVRLSDLLLDPPYALVRQASAPRRQRHGRINADGFGVGWWADGDREPAVYRRDRPIWTDRDFPGVARVVRTRALVAAVRNGTVGTASGEDAVAPFVSGAWLFSHNGRLAGWPHDVAALAAGLPAHDLLTMAARVDSALLLLLVQRALDRGCSPGQALACVVEQAAAAGGGRLNLLLSDGHRVAATAWGDSLSYRAGAGEVVVASEPYDDEPGWVDVEDGMLVEASLGDGGATAGAAVTVRAISAAAQEAS